MSAPATEPGVVVWRAGAVLPYEDARSAAAGLRAELRHQLAGGPEPDWSTFAVSLPRPAPDRFGRMWFHYSATVSLPG